MNFLLYIARFLLPDEKMEEYTTLQPLDFVGKNPQKFALEFGKDDPINAMVSLAAINAICQHVMREIDYAVDSATDSLGLLSISAGDNVGMVGLFTPLIKTIKKAGAEMVVLEKKEQLVQRHPDLHITLDTTNLQS